MNETFRKENEFVGYEYKDVTINDQMQQLYTDSYENFGWTLDATEMPMGKPNAITLKFKRDRKIRNKAELTRLQRQFDACAGEVLALERSKVTTAATIAYIIGLVGTAFLAGAVFAYLAGMIPLMIILALPGLAGWVLSYFAYAKIVKNKTTHIAPLIETKYDEIYGVCERANGLLAHA